MNNRFKFRIFDKETGKYYKTRTSKGSGCIVYQHPASSHYAWIQIGTLFAKLEQDEKTYAQTGLEPDFIIEQCTGLSDKNGNLIYEGDILDCELQDIDSHGYPFIHFKKGVVKRAKNGAYCVEGDDDFYASDITLYPIEIIGNIHEQAEQKDK